MIHVNMMEGQLKPTLLAIFLAISCATMSCRRAGVPDDAARLKVEADIASIKAAFGDFVRLYNTGDFKRIMSLYYTEASIQMPPNESLRKGKAPILLGYRKAREVYDEYIDRSTIDEVRVSGDIAVARGSDTGISASRAGVGGGPVAYSLKWMTVLERQSDGTWKWIYEMWNDNDPIHKAPEKENRE